GDLAFKAQAPALHLVRAEVRRRGCLGQVTRIQLPDERSQACEKQRPNIRGGRNRGKRRSGYGVKQGGGCAPRVVQDDVVERGVIGHPVTAPDGGLAMTGDEAAPLRRVGKAKARTNRLFVSRLGGGRGDGGWQGR